MNPNRKAFYPDVIVFYVCIVIGAWFFGYEFGIAQIKGCVVQEAKVHTMTNPPLYRGARAQKLWAKYEATK